MQKEPLLFLCHRIPFPPNKGDKIRSFNILKALAENYDVYLASFVDDPFDWQYADKLDEFCAEKLLVSQNKSLCKVKGLSAFLTNKPITLPYYANNKVMSWVKHIVAEKQIERIFVYSSAMAQFAEPVLNNSTKLVVDFVDVDSDKWRQYASEKTGLSAWVYQREYRQLQQYENHVAALANHSLFVSPQEAELFKQQLPTPDSYSVSGVLNGVDTEFFDPSADDIETVDGNIDVVFTGAMDYWANVNAVVWFVQSVWPLIRAKKPDATFFVVGGNPTKDIQALDGMNGITVTGRVKDVRPYIVQSKAAVAPLQIARGIQNKVLEAMSMAKPVVATSMAIEGIDTDAEHVVVVDQPDQYADSVMHFMDQPTEAPESRQWIMDNLRWVATLSGLAGLYDGN